MDGACGATGRLDRTTDMTAVVPLQKQVSEMKSQNEKMLVYSIGEGVVF